MSADGGRATAVDGLVRWLLDDGGCAAEAGLSEVELTRAQDTFGLTFPSLWRALLARMLPVAQLQAPRGPDGVLGDRRFPDWRLRDVAATRVMVEAPMRGVLLDVTNGGFWWPDWGPRPASAADRRRVAAAALADAPRLTPIRDHLYIGAQDDGPVFSIVHTDLWVAAPRLSDLAAAPEARSRAGAPVELPFWTALHAWSQAPT